MNYFLTQKATGKCHMRGDSKAACKACKRALPRSVKRQIHRMCKEITDNRQDRRKCKNKAKKAECPNVCPAPRGDSTGELQDEAEDAEERATGYHLQYRLPWRTLRSTSPPCMRTLSSSSTNSHSSCTLAVFGGNCKKQTQRSHVCLFVSVSQCMSSSMLLLCENQAINLPDEETSSYLCGWRRSCR